MSLTNFDNKLTYLSIRKIQLDERHRTIMEAWDDRSNSKTNLKLKSMYNQLWEELEQVNKELKSLTPKY